jgi:hypothetical protein
MAPCSMSWSLIGKPISPTRPERRGRALLPGNSIDPAAGVGTLSFVTEGGFAVAAIDAPDHGDRPRDEELARLGAEIRTGWGPGMRRLRRSPPCVT